MLEQYCPGKVFPQRRSCVETLRAPSLPLIAPPLRFPRYCAPEGALKGGLGSLEAWRLGSLVLLVGHYPTPRLLISRRETEGGGRGQRRSRRATDGARSGSRLPSRLCGLPRTLLMLKIPLYIYKVGMRLNVPEEISKETQVSFSWKSAQATGMHRRCRNIPAG